MNNNLIGFSPISRTIEGDARYTDTTLWDGQWVYVAVTRTEDGTNTMYVNGKKVSPEVRSISSNSQQAQDGVVCIGADYTTKYGPGNSLCLDEVKIWNRALSAEEVAYVYGATPEMESLRVEGPEKAAVGETGITIDLTAKATKNNWAKWSRWSQSPGK